MTKKHQNLKQYVDSLDAKYEFYTKVAETCGVSLTTAINWCRMYYIPPRKEQQESISEMTGISITDLFKK